MQELHTIGMNLTSLTFDTSPVGTNPYFSNSPSPPFAKIYPPIHALATIAVAAVGLPGYQQHYVRDVVFDLSCATVHSATAGHPAANDVIVTGSLESNAVNLSCMFNSSASANIHCEL